MAAPEKRTKAKKREKKNASTIFASSPHVVLLCSAPGVARAFTDLYTVVYRVAFRKIKRLSLSLSLFLASFLGADIMTTVKR